MTGEPTVTPDQVLITHQQLQAGGCVAGCPLDWGSSFAQHQLAMLREAGYAIVRDYAPRVTIPSAQHPDRAAASMCARATVASGWTYTCQRRTGHPGLHMDGGVMW